MLQSGIVGIKAQPDDMYRGAGKRDRNFGAGQIGHGVRVCCRRCAVLAADFVVVGQGPQLHAIALGAGGEVFGGEGAVRDNRMAMEVGVQELNSSNLSVYPNPSNGNITIAGADLNGPVNFELTDMTGRVVYKEQRTMNSGQPVTLALNGKLAQGTYLLRMITDNGISSRAVMIK